MAVAGWSDIAEYKIHIHLKRLGRHVRNEWFREGIETEAVLSAMAIGTVAAYNDLLQRWATAAQFSINPRLKRVLSIANG